MEYITNTSWESLADVKIRLRETPEINIPDTSCVIHFTTEFTADIFKVLEQKYLSNPELKYICISSNSDCGVCYQSEHPVSQDLKKAIFMVDLNIGYKDLHLQSRCLPDKCNINHKFSIKMYATTYATIDRVPPNVIKWYTTNNDTDEPNIVGIPFGTPPWFTGAKEYYVTKFNKTNLTNNRIYFGFAANTLERCQLLYQYDTDDNYLVRKSFVSHEQYLQDMLDCDLIMSPSGNGMDCYRNLESIYLGKIPIIPNNRIQRPYIGLPYTISGKGINHLLNIIEYENTTADLNYWKCLVNKDKELL